MSTNCLQPSSGTGIFSFALANDSDVFTAVSNLYDVSSSGANDTFIAPPEFDNVELNANVGSAGAAQLQDVGGFNQSGAPSFSGSAPSLTKPAYDAVVSAVDLPFTAPTISGISYGSGLDAITVPNASPGPPPLNYPEEGMITLPPRPGVGELPVPELLPGDKPDLTPIRPEVFVPYGLQPLSGLDIPEYEPPDVEKLQWQDELVYSDDDGLQSKLRELMQGNDEVAQWIGSAVQAKLYDADKRRLPVDAKRQIDTALDAAAGRNFSLPHGATDMAVARAAEVELDGSFEIAQQVGNEVYEAAVGTVVDAVSRSIQVEQYHFRLYMRYLQQNLRVYRRNIELAGEIYNQLVQVFNRALGLVRSQVEAYNQYVQAVSAENRAAAAGVGFQEAQVQTFRARIAMFRADVGLRTKAAQMLSSEVQQQLFPLDEYRAELEGHMGNLQIMQQNMNSFQQAVQAYSQQMDWYDDAIGAFEAGTEASLGKVNVNTTKFGAYSRLWSAEQDRSSAYRDYVSSSFSVFDSELQNYREAARSQQQYLSSVNQAVSASVQGIGSFSRMASEMSQHAGDYNSAKIAYTSASDSVDISDATSNMAQQAISAEAEAQEARLDAAREAAKVTAAGALAQASSSIFQVSASAEGSADQRVSGRDSGSSRTSGQNRRTFNQSCVQTTRPATV